MNTLYQFHLLLLHLFLFSTLPGGISALQGDDESEDGDWSDAFSQTSVFTLYQYISDGASDCDWPESEDDASTSADDSDDSDATESCADIPGIIDIIPPPPSRRCPVNPSSSQSGGASSSGYNPNPAPGCDPTPPEPSPSSLVESLPPPGDSPAQLGLVCIDGTWTQLCHSVVRQRFEAIVHPSRVFLPVSDESGSDDGDDSLPSIGDL